MVDRHEGMARGTRRVGVLDVSTDFYQMNSGWAKKWIALIEEYDSLFQWTTRPCYADPIRTAHGWLSRRDWTGGLDGLEFLT